MHMPGQSNWGSRRYSIRSSQFGPSDQANPYGAGGSTQPPPKKSMMWLWILLGVGAVVLLGCCGCFGVVGFGSKGLVDVAMNKAAEELRPSLAADPVIQQHIGDIQTLQLDFGASMTEAQNSGKQGELVLTIKGTKGEGTVIGKPPSGAGNKFENGRLRMSTGEEYPLTP